MSKKSLVLVLLAVGLLLWAGTARATVECCCDPLTCTFNPTAAAKFLGVQPRDVFINDCYYWEDEKSWQCDERLVCIAEISDDEPLFAITYDLENIIVDGLCDLHLGDDTCEAEYVLGTDHAGLETLRQFRDEVLVKSARGKRLIRAYYRYRDELIESFVKDTALMLFTAELLERTIARLQETPGSGQELYADDIAADMAILIDELDGIVTNQQFKKLLQQVKGDLAAKTLF